MNASNDNVKGLVSEIRKRWRRRALIQGGALTLLTLLFFATVLLLLYTNVAVEPVALVVGVVVAAVVVLGMLAWFVLRPGFRKLSDRQIALFVEEKIPDLEDRLNSAVEVGEADDVRVREDHGALVDKIIDDAARKTKAIPMTTVIDRKRERILTYSAAACLVVFLLFGYTAVDKIQFTASGFDLAAVTEGAVPFMTIDPGNVEIEKGASQEVIVSLRDETDQDVVIVYKEGEGEWAKEPMQKGVGDPSYLQEFFNIQEPVQYYVEVGETRSEPFVISLYEFPEVDQIDITYRYPDYTGLPPRTEEDTGDIRGLKGSTAIVTLQTTGTVQEAEMILDDDQKITLKPLGDGRFRGSIKLDKENLYSFRLTDEMNKNNKFPDEYQIVPIDDEKPYITITDPQRDVRANAIEEVLVAADVQDDYGVKSLQLVFSVNGDEEQSISLKDDGEERLQEVSGEHLFFLEDYSLEPGDVISYYLEAEDYFHPTSEATDMYFIEVIPFDQKFSQANNMGGGGGGGQQSGLVLSQQEIIAATWKLLRRRAEMDQDEYDESARALAQAQENLKNNIEQRINSTAFSMELQGDEGQQKVVEYLRKAIEEMTKAVADLQADRLKKALTPERRALNNLLRADALNKENQVARQQGQGGGGNQSAREERMTELMDLELDISKDKYEVQQQRSQQQQQSQQLDETLRKVQELARRQQNLAQQNNPDELEGEDKQRFIDRLKREQDELREQVEQLSQNMQQQNSQNNQNARQSRGGQSGQEAQQRRQQQQRMQERLDRAAQNMREAEQALQRENLEDAMRRQQQAINELDRLQQDLRMAARGTTREMLEDLAQQFDEFRDQEEQLGRDIDKANEQARAQGGRADEETLDRLEEKRQQMIENLDDLLTQADNVQESVRNEDPELATTIRNLIQQARRDGLEENMRRSEQAIQQGWLDTADRIEENIQAAIERLESQRRAFEDSLPVTEEEQVAQSLDDVRDLMRQLEQLQAQAERMRRQENGQQQGQQGQQQRGQQGQQQNQQQGQQGQQQQGQQGQQQGQGQGQNRQGQADAARMQSQMDRARETLERLEREFSDSPATRNALNSIQNALNRADHTGVLLDEESADDFFNERVYDPLSQLEIELARQLDLIQMEKKLYGSRKGDVPPEYREMVEKYYESLSKGTNNN